MSEKAITQNESARLLREKDVSERYGLSLPFLRKARWKGNGPQFVKIGSMVYYRPEDMEAWVESLMVSSTTEATARRARV